MPQRYPAGCHGKDAQLKETTRFYNTSPEITLAVILYPLSEGSGLIVCVLSKQ